MNSPVPTSDKRVKEVEKNVQEEMWQFIAGTIKQGLKQFVENLRVPQVAEGPVDLQLFNKYERRRPDVDAAIGRLFLEGVSTRRLKGIARDLFGQEVSATTVSKTVGYLDEELKRYQSRPLGDDFPFLFLDGISQKVMEIGIEKKVMLCALGLKEDGIKQMLSFRLVDQEDTDSWRAFLVDIKSRGLMGKALRLITTDGNPALLKANSSYT